MGEGWETARRRDDGNDWVELRLGGAGVVRLAELDTSWFVGNAPGWASLRGSTPGPPTRRPAAWTELLARTRLQPDTRHRFRLDGGPEVTHVRLDVYPDGGLAGLRLHGELSAAARRSWGCAGSTCSPTTTPARSSPPPGRLRRCRPGPARWG